MTRAVSSSLVVLAASLSLASCAHPSAGAPQQAAVEKRPPPARIHRFDIGALHAVALRDGDIEEANDGQTFALGHTPAEVSALFGHETATIPMDIQPLLVRDGEHTFLFDTGALAPSWAPHAGALVASLHLAGVEPEAITDIFISHGHEDHVGGLLTTGGALAFPRATLHLSAAEWEALRSSKKTAALASVIAPRVVPFAPGATLFDSVTAVAADGHTPGHSAYRIGHGAESILYVGDSMHSSVVSLRRPGWKNAYDQDQERGRANREALLERAATEHAHLFVPHFPFPGTGHVTAGPDGYTWIPDDDASR